MKSVCKDCVYYKSCGIDDRTEYCGGKLIRRLSREELERKVKLLEIRLALKEKQLEKLKNNKGKEVL